MPDEGLKAALEHERDRLLAKLPPDGNLTVREAMQFKYELAKDMSYAGMNPKDYKEYKRPTQTHWKQVNSDYDSGYCRVVEVFRSRWYFLFLLIGVAGFSYFGFWYLRYTFAALGLTALYVLTKRDGHRKGFMEGFEWGFHEAIDHAAGVTRKESIEIDQIATGMEIHEMTFHKTEEPK